VDALKAKISEDDAMKARPDALERAMSLPEWHPSKKEEIIERRIEAGERTAHPLRKSRRSSGGETTDDLQSRDQRQSGGRVKKTASESS